MDENPIKPQGARLVRGDVTTPLELTYVGLDAEGQHVWRAEARLVPDVDQLLFDMVPARTSIEVVPPRE